MWNVRGLFLFGCVFCLKGYTEPNEIARVKRAVDSTATSVSPISSTSSSSVSTNDKSTTMAAMAVGSSKPIVTISANPSTSIRFNTTLNITAMVTANPSANSAKWQRKLQNGKWSDIDISDSTYVGSSVTPGAPILVISDITYSEDNTAFRCVVRNAEGETTSNEITIDVTGGVDRVQVIASITEDAYSSMAPDPTFVFVGDLPTVSVTPVGPVQLPYGTTLTSVLVATVTTGSNTQPAQEVRWRKITSGNEENINISNSKYAGSTHALTNPKLVINNAVFGDEAKYHCQAMNAEGWGTSNKVSVNVTGGALSVRVGSDAMGNIGERVNISCTVTGPEISQVTWKKGGTDLSIDGINYTGSTPSSPSLIINNMVMQDGDRYQCTATNPGGTYISSRSAALTVINRQFQDSCNVSLPCDNSKELQCSQSKCVCGESFYHNNNLCYPRERLKVTITSHLSNTSAFTVSWNPPSINMYLVSGYIVRWRIHDQAESTQESQTVANSVISYTVNTGLIPGQLYIVTVTSDVTLIDPASNIEVLSDLKYIRIVPLPPGSILDSSYFGADKLMLSWTPPINNTVVYKYVVRIDGATQSTLGSNANIAFIKQVIPGYSYNALIVMVSGQNINNDEEKMSVPYHEIIKITPTNVVNLDILMESSPIIEGRTTGYIKCYLNSAQNVSSGKVNFTWIKNGLTLQRSSFWSISSTCDYMNCFSVIDFLQISILLEGRYTCNVEADDIGTYYNGTELVDIVLKQKPSLVMHPISTVISEGTSVVINCHITNVLEAYFESNDTILKLCFSNMTEITNYIGDMYNKSYVFAAILTNETFMCGLGNCTNSVKSSRISVTKKEVRLCPQDNVWPSALAGQYATAPCPSGYIGTQNRSCDKDGKWGKIQADTCKQEKLDKIEKALNSSVNISESTIESSLSTISEVVNQTFTSGEKVMASVDIVQSVTLIAKISEKNIVFTDQKAAEKTTETFMSVVSNLMETGKDHVTSKNKTQGKDVTGKILSSVDGFSKSVTKVLTVNQTVTVEKNNILLSIERVPKQNIVFPKKTEDEADDDTSFTLPEEALKNIKGNSVAFTAVKYDNFGSEFDVEEKNKNSTIGSSVLSLTVENLEELTENISLTFDQNSRNVSANSTPECVFLNEQKHSWNNSGCSVYQSNSSYTACTCNHLTSFAILISMDLGDDDKRSTQDEERLTMISIIGCICSVVGALATIFIYLYFWRYMKSRRSVLIINLCLAMFIAYMLFLTAVNRTGNHIGCIIIAALLHYFFLAMFCIMLALGIDLAVAVLDVFSSRSSSFLLLLLGWGLPAVIVGLTLGVTETHGFGDNEVCWLGRTARYGFIIPALIIIMINFVILIVVMKTMFSSSFMIKKSIKEKARSGMRGMCALLPVLGLTWVFGILSINQHTIVFEYLFAIFNSLQGLFIFVFHVLFNNQVRRALSSKIKKYESRTLSSNSPKHKFESKSSSKDLHSDDEIKDFQNDSSGFLLSRMKVSNPVRRTSYTAF